MTEPGRRTVMSPQTRAALGLATDAQSTRAARARTAPTRTAAGESARDTVTGLAVAMRVQRRLALRTMAALLAGLLLLPVVLEHAPHVASWRIADVPIVWIVLGGLVYPALWVLAEHHRKSVERLEQQLAARDGSPVA